MQLDNVENRNCGCNNSLATMNNGMMPVNNDNDYDSVDTKAVCLHRKYCKELKELKDKYQKVYGPLTIEFPCNKGRWIEEPWGSFYLGVILQPTIFFILPFGRL